ncbi:MAG: DUF427 domain-containing protein [Thalassovita sp.]
MACFIANLPGKSIHNPSVPTHFMWVQRVAGQVSIYHENLVLAVSNDALRVIEVGTDVYEPVLYLPSRDICTDLRSGQLTTHCPLKGDASYFDLVDAAGSIIVANAAWSHPEPLDIAASLQGHVAFDPLHFAIETAPL